MELTLEQKFALYAFVRDCEQEDLHHALDAVRVKEGLPVEFERLAEEVRAAVLRMQEYVVKAINRQDNENDPELMRQFEEAGYIVNVKLDDEDKENKPPNAKREIINLDSDDEDMPPRAPVFKRLALAPVEEVEQNDL